MRQEGPDDHLERTRDLTQHLATNDVIGLGEHIYKAWKKQGSMRKADLWGLYQLGHTAGPEAMLHLWTVSQHPNKDVERWLTVLERRQTPIARTLLLLLEKHYKAMDTKRLSYADLLCASGLKKRLVEHREAWSGKEKLTALAASGRLRPGFGLGLLTLDRIGGDHLWGAWRHPHYWTWTQGKHTFVCSARHSDDGRPASPQQALELFITQVSSKKNSKPDNHQFRKALATLKSRQQELDDDIQRFHKALKRLGRKVCWTHADWHQQMCVHPVSSLPCRGLLFHQPDGPVFGVNPALEPVDVHGNPVTVDKSRFILRTTAKDLSPQDHQSWAKRMAQWREAWDAQTPKPVRFGVEDHNASDKLAELRQLLYNPPTSNHWRQVRTVFDTIKDDPQGMDSAIEYARPLLDASWGDVLRFPPEDWVHGQHFDTGKDPRLVLCNAIAATEVYTSNGSVALGTMANTADFNHIQWLMIGSSNCTRDSFKTMGRKGFMPSVTKFILSPCIGSTPAWTRFCKSPLMQRLDTLIIHQGLNADQFQPIIDSGLLGNLRHLEIAGVNHTQAKAIIAGLDPKKLRCLGFDGAFNAKTARLVALENEQLSSLEVLKTGEISQKSRDILCGSPYLSQQALAALPE